MVSLGKLASKLFGDSNERKLKAYRPNVDAINALESELEGLSDDALRARTDAFRQQVKEGASLDELLVRSARAPATRVRARRTLRPVESTAMRSRRRSPNGRS